MIKSNQKGDVNKIHESNQIQTGFTIQVESLPPSLSHAILNTFIS